jgi:hypothetical protein
LRVCSGKRYSQRESIEVFRSAEQQERSDMRVCVGTVFNEYFNYESFLQAFALKQFLRAHDVQIEFADPPS